MEFVSDLLCINCGRSYQPRPEQYLCGDCGEQGILEVGYDYPVLKKEWSREQLKQNPDPSIWRYTPLLPIRPQTPRPRLRIGMTPLYQSKALGEKVGLNNIYIKDDGLNPTGSLKDRASAIAVVKGQEAGADIVACASTGNAASSLAGNIASMGGKMRAVIFIPARAPLGKLTQLLVYGAVVVSVQGSYQDAYRLSERAIEQWGWYNRNAAINPYLVEGKKTVALELAEQLNWELPDWLVFSVGDGCTIAGAWKGLVDLKKLGFIDRLPRLLGVQAEGSAPITKAFKSGKALEVSGEDTLADSIAVGNPRNYVKALRAIRASGGDMVNVADQEILGMIQLLAEKTGVFGEPAGVAGLAGLQKMTARGLIKAGEQVVAVITGNGLKDSKNAQLATGKPFRVEPDFGVLERIVKEGNLV